MLNTYFLLLKVILLTHGENPKCGENLIENGDAENFGIGCDKLECPHEWYCNGSIRQRVYYSRYLSGISQTYYTPGPRNRGQCYFFGGTDQYTSMYQTINLTSHADLIDNEIASFYFSAWLGGLVWQRDLSTVTIEFQNCTSQQIGNNTTIGPVLRDERNWRTGLFPREAEGAIPASSRWMVITVKMVKDEGWDNDGAVDNIYFEIICNNQMANANKDKQQNAIVISYNQSTFDSCARWNSQPMTFLNSSTDNVQIVGLNVVPPSISYNGCMNFSEILIHNQENLTLTRNNSVELNDSKIFFIRTNGDIYFHKSNFTQLVQNWTNASESSMSILSLISQCANIFIDHKNQLYCSRKEKHKVIIIQMYDILNISRTIGTGISGLAAHLLSQPTGIFVDENSNLYVADSGNNRIQLFSQDNSNGVTLAENLLSNGLNFPTGVVVDKSRNVFIADYGNNRIVMSTTDGIRCLIGCSMDSPLQQPETLWFDHVGNMFVLDSTKKRIQKFSLTTYDHSACFLEFTCLDPVRFGINCSFSKTKCNLSQPCQNGGTCNDISNGLEYNCSCPPNFDGEHCENDYQICKENICWNNGTCHNISETDFNCSCALGWEGKHCERKINLCLSSPCQNRGVCFPSLRNYTCECLRGSYFGRHCEISATRIKVLKIVSTSISYIAIIAMGAVAIFVLVMDILKYGFGIDPVEGERERIRREKFAKKKKHPVIQRFVYVNAPSSTEPTTEPAQ